MESIWISQKILDNSCRVLVVVLILHGILEKLANGLEHTVRSLGPIHHHVTTFAKMPRFEPIIWFVTIIVALAKPFENAPPCTLATRVKLAEIRRLEIPNTKLTYAAIGDDWERVRLSRLSL